MTAGAILSVLVNWVTSFAIGFKTLTIPWGVNGYFQAMGWPAGSRVLSNWWPHSERGMVYGMYTFAAGCASVLSFVTSLIVVHTLQLSWHWIFRLPVILMLLGGIVFYLVVRERPEDVGFKTPDNDNADAREKASELAIDINESSLSRYVGVLKDKRLFVAALAIGFQNIGRYGLLIWVPVHFMGTDWAKATNTIIDPKWISVALPVGMALGALTNGWLSDKLFGSKRYPAILMFMVLGAGTSLWMYTLPGHSLIGIVALFLAGFFVFGPASCFWALCPDLVGAKRAGTATGVLNFFSYLFAGIAEPIIGRILDKSGDTSQIFVIVAFACIVSAVVAPFIRR
jgi:OPA family glycerol-3-phosphate transporter-like MFS transporter